MVLEHLIGTLLITPDPLFLLAYLQMRIRPSVLLD